MTKQRMVELLETEHECMLRKSHADCDSDCGKCDLAQDDYELHEMYTDVIALLNEDDYVIPVRDNSWPLLNVWVCPKCDGVITTTESIHPKYCAGCGRRVKWNDA